VQAPPRGAQAKPKRRLWVRLLRLALHLIVWGSLALGLALIPFLWDLPRPEVALDAARRPSLSIEDRQGRVLASYGDVTGEAMHLADLPAYLPQAAVAVEDRRFYYHFGVDPVGLLRALYVNLRSGRVVQGGSTLSQQVAKNLFLSNARTFRRKVQEVLLTLWLEHKFSKRQILEIWLNRVYLGAGAWGVDAASHVYFGIPASKLNLWQSAMIAGLPRAPSRFNPRSNPEAAAARAREVLAAMVENGSITQAEAQAASASISFAARPGTDTGWFADWIADRSDAVVPPSSDAVLRTTLDRNLQAIAEQKLTAILDGPGRAQGVSEGAVVALDANTGAVRAMVGGRDYHASPYNRAVNARRQPGSAFKPFVWLTALNDGAHPDDTVTDAPISVGGWSPQNFEHRYRGDITLEEALAHSVNTVSVRLLLGHGGGAAVAATARRLGIADKLDTNPSLALGTSEVGLLELTGAYAAFFNGGIRVKPTGIESVTLNGHPSTAGKVAPERVMDTETANAMKRMLQAVVARGSGVAAAVPGHEVGGKTGTTQESRDAWFIGAVDGLVIGVWLGNDDNHPMQGVIGGGLPARVFHDIAAAR
jgi:penicillin-binding protein 1A